VQLTQQHKLSRPATLICWTHCEAVGKPGGQTPRAHWMFSACPASDSLTTVVANKRATTINANISFYLK